MFELPAALLSWFFGLTGSYTIAIALMAVIVMAITTPLTLKSTKGMLEMQKIAPEMRRLQNEHRNDRQKLNEEMMKLYQEHKVNPMSSCLPIFAQMPVFIVMFRVLRGLTYTPRGDANPIADATLRALGQTEPDPGFVPRYQSIDSAIFDDLYDKFDIPELGLDFSLTPFDAITNNPLTGLVYAGLVVLLGALYFAQQRMVAARATMSPTMSPTQQKVMQYLPVVFAVFQIFFLTALVIYYIFQTLLRILQQYYVTRKFYGGDESLGRQAQRASEAARDEAKKNGESGGMFGQIKRDLAGGRDNASDDKSAPPKARPGAQSKRVTPPKNRPTSTKSTKPTKPTKSTGSSTGGDGAGSGGGKGRPTPTRQQAQASRAKPSKSKASKPTKSTRPPSGKNKR
jgi:YidC/Oxa1 family membrane protein insertase